MTGDDSQIRDRCDQLDTASIRRGLADVAAVRVRPAREAIETLAIELGLKRGNVQHPRSVKWVPPPMDE